MWPAGGQTHYTVTGAPATLTTKKWEKTLGGNDSNSYLETFKVFFKDPYHQEHLNVQLCI